MSFSGLSGGGGADGGADTSTLHLEASAHDANAKADGRRSADVVSPPADAGTAKDTSTGHDAQQTADTSRPPPPSDGCVPILVDAGEGPACPASDASCAPKPASGFTATFVPPVPRSSSCTKTQINTFTGNCFTPTDAGQGACSAFEMDSANDTCLQCLLGSSSTSGSTFGPVLSTPEGVSELDIGGCIALLDPCQMGCASAVEAQTQCIEYACGGCATMGQTIFESCISTAQTCTCLPQTNALNNCRAKLEGTAAATCFPLTSFLQGANELSQVFCNGDAGN